MAPTPNLDPIARALVAVIITGTTAAAVLLPRELPPEWWPSLVAILAYLYNGNQRPPNNGGTNGSRP